MHIKIPQTQYPVSELIKNRWSARSFTGESLDEITLFTLFEAAHWAASSMNEQPWLYTYANNADEAAFEKFHSCLLPGNIPWTAKASVIILCCAQMTHAANGKPNKYSFFDCGSSVTTLLLEAAQHGVYGHIMGGFDVEKTKATFGLADNIEPAAFLVLGKLAAPELLEEPFKTRELTPRSRKPLSEVVFKTHY